ncbi:MAG: YiiX/YebB-like N1pC/P60 family cysteine hydrolase, partial [Oricola sp.]
EGPVVIEAHRSGVRVQRLDQVIDVDTVAVLRPTLGDAQRREAVVRAFALIGTPFDFRFDASTPECLFCTEMVMRVIPQLRVPVRHAYGRPTVLPDEMARIALVPGKGLDLSQYVEGTRNGWRIASPRDLEEALETAWRPKALPSH